MYSKYSSVTQEAVWMVTIAVPMFCLNGSIHVAVQQELVALR